MKRLLSLLLMPFLCLGICRAQQRVHDNKSLLWRISGNGLKQPSFLFGTIHLICPDDYLWTEAMKKSLASCKEVCFEMDMDDPATMQNAVAGMMTPGAKDLREYFSAEEYARVTTFAKDSFGIDLNVFRQMRPVFLQTLFVTKTTGCESPVSYENRIMAEAQKKKIEVTGLEPAEEQLAVLAGMPDDSVARSIVSMADSFGNTIAAYEKMVEVYKQQDLPELYKQINEAKDLGEDLGPILDDRNAKWIPRMAKRISKNPVFFAVGAGHLWGNKGVITLLRSQGYTVEAVH